VPVRAKIDRKFLLRLGLTALAFAAFASWFLYDGTITYPRQRERALEYLKLEEEGRLDEWEAIAAERGWPTENPGEPREVAEIYAQLVLASLLALPALLYVFLFLRARGRWIEMDENGLRTSWGRQLEFDDIVLLDKKLWRKKGIAKITYEQNGRKRRLVLDDWKYDAEETKEILCEVESHIEIDQIVGGIPEVFDDDEQYDDEHGDDEHHDVRNEEQDEPAQQEAK
jgi:hypothetical protein